MQDDRDPGALLRRMCLLVGLLPTPPPRTPNVALWTAHSTATVGPDTPVERSKPLLLLAARGEKESFQLLLRTTGTSGPQDPQLNVNVSCTDAMRSGSHGSEPTISSGVDITLRKVVCVHGTPDALVPLSNSNGTIHTYPGETTVLWISVDVPRALPPGIYNAEIVVTAAAAVTAQPDQDGEALRRWLERCHAHTEGLISSVPDIHTDSTTLEAGLRGLQEQLKQLRASVTRSSHPSQIPATVLGRLAFQIRVWNFTLPVTPSIPLVMGISDEIFEKRFGLKRGSPCWKNTLDAYARWFLSYRMSPYFCRWGHGGDHMALLTYTSPWPLDDEHGDALLSDPRLAAYAVPFSPDAVAPACTHSTSEGTSDKVPSGEPSESALSKTLRQLRNRSHFRKAYFYLWDEPVKSQQYKQIREWAHEIHAVVPEARVLTTYYCGLEDGPFPKGSFDALLAVPQQLRGATQLFCISQWALGGRKIACDAIRNQLQGKEEWWGYVCMGPGNPEPNWHLDMTGTQHRAVLWRAWDEAATGYLYWGANCYKDASSVNENIDFRDGLPPGDGVLVYPGEAFGSGSQPIASIRLERALSGLQDYEYLQAHAGHFGRAATSKLLHNSDVYVQPSMYVHPSRSSCIDALRIRIAADLQHL